MPRPAVAEAFETQPIGWPFPRVLLAAYAAAFAAGLLLTCLGLSLTAQLAGATWQIPPLAPFVAVVAGLELVRVARWRSTRYVVIGHRVVVRRGIAWTAAVASVDARGAVVRRGTTDVAVAGASMTLALEGVDASVWDAFADALRRAGAEVEPASAAPTPRRARPSPQLVLALASVALALGGAVELRVRLDRQRSAEHALVASSARDACDVALQDATTNLAKWRARLDRRFARANWVRAYVGARTRRRCSLREEDELTLVLDVDWPAANGTDPGRRTVCVVRVERPWRLVPDRVRVTVCGDPLDPLASAVMAHVRAQLARAGVAHGVAYSSRSATIQGAASNAP